MYSLTQLNWCLLLKHVFYTIISSYIFRFFRSHLKAELYFLKKAVYTIVL